MTDYAAIKTACQKLWANGTFAAAEAFLKQSSRFLKKTRTQYELEASPPLPEGIEALERHLHDEAAYKTFLKMYIDPAFGGQGLYEGGPEADFKSLSREQAADMASPASFYERHMHAAARAFPPGEGDVFRIEASREYRRAFVLGVAKNFRARTAQRQDKLRTGLRQVWFVFTGVPLMVGAGLWALQAPVVPDEARVPLEMAMYGFAAAAAATLFVLIRQQGQRYKVGFDARFRNQTKQSSLALAHHLTARQGWLDRMVSDCLDRARQDKDSLWEKGREAEWPRQRRRWVQAALWLQRLSEAERAFSDALDQMLLTCYAAVSTRGEYEAHFSPVRPDTPLTDIIGMQRSGRALAVGAGLVLSAAMVGLSGHLFGRPAGALMLVLCVGLTFGGLWAARRLRADLDTVEPPAQVFGNIFQGHTATAMPQDILAGYLEQDGLRQLREEQKRSWK